MVRIHTMMSLAHCAMVKLQLAIGRMQLTPGSSLKVVPCCSLELTPGGDSRMSIFLPFLSPGPAYCSALKRS